MVCSMTDEAGREVAILRLEGQKREEEGRGEEKEGVRRKEERRRGRKEIEEEEAEGKREGGDDMPMDTSGGCVACYCHPPTTATVVFSVHLPFHAAARTLHL